MVPSTENVLPHAIYTADKPLGRHLLKVWVVVMPLSPPSNPDSTKTKNSHLITLFMRQKTIFDDLSSPFLFFTLN